jgi:molybdopterin molybdotransferase
VLVITEIEEFAVIPLAEALAIVDREATGRRLTDTQTLPVGQAASRFLASDQHSKLDLPPFDKSAVDGYAVGEGEVRSDYRLTGVVRAGQPGAVKLAPGTTVKVMTGAPVPPGTVRVVMVEQATERAGLVRLEPRGADTNISKQAAHVAVGQIVLAAGTRLGPLSVANLICCGISEVDVTRQVRLAIIPTGDEIKDSPDELSPGKIMNTNGPLLNGLALKWGLQVTRCNAVRDDKILLREALEESLVEADIVVLSGGVSSGDFDLVPEIMADCGCKIHFSRVGSKPGKPMAFATGPDAILFGLPGSPVAVYLTFHLYVLRAAALLAGGRYQPREFQARLARDFSRSTKHAEHCPGYLTNYGRVETVAYHGSNHLAALMRADGFSVIPQGVQSLTAGADVTFVMFEERGT